MKSEIYNFITSIVHSLYKQLSQEQYSHGKRIAYIVFELLKSSQEFTNEEKQDIYMLCLLHDIGAESTQKSIRIIYNNCYAKIHKTIVSYMLLKTFSPLAAYADCILYHYQHNARYHSVPIYKKHRYIAGLLYLANYIDEKSQKQLYTIHGVSLSLKNSGFEREFLQFFFECDKKHAILSNLSSGSYEQILNAYVQQNITISKMNMYNYFNTFLFSKDFGSSFYAYKIMNAVFYGQKFSEALELDRNVMELIKLTSILHHIGNPAALLESEPLFQISCKDPLLMIIKESSLLLHCFAGNRKIRFSPSAPSEIVALSVFISNCLSEKSGPQRSNSEMISYIREIYSNCGLSSALLTKLTIHYPEIKREIATSNQHLKIINKNLRDEYQFLKNMLIHYHHKYE